MTTRKSILMLVVSYVGLFAAGTTLTADDHSPIEWRVAQLRVTREQMQKGQQYFTMKERERRRPGSFSVDELHAKSLELLKGELDLSKSRPEAVNAALAYLEREGFTVAKKD